MPVMSLRPVRWAVRWPSWWAGRSSGRARRNAPLHALSWSRSSRTRAASVATLPSLGSCAAHISWPARHTSTAASRAGSSSGTGATMRRMQMEACRRGNTVCANAPRCSGTTPVIMSSPPGTRSCACADPPCPLVAHRSFWERNTRGCTRRTTNCHGSGSVPTLAVKATPTCPTTCRMLSSGSACRPATSALTHSSTSSSVARL
mmetsp:Transcript_36180/g.90793  ORF Transcript_36180/g.90793 Transcript_36180/m.90793 type:complete len:204 (-) Transcript_36180:1612-2223(-)